MVQHIESKEQFQALLQSGKPTLVDFWATWCGPCKRIAPIIEELGTEYEGRANVVKVDVEEVDEVAVDFQVTSIPTLVFLDKEGKLAQRLVGVQTKAKLQEELNKLL